MPSSLGGPAPKLPTSKSLLQHALGQPSPHPMIVLPKQGGFWVDPPDQDHDVPVDSEGNPVLPKVNFKVKFEMDETARSYRAHFLGYEHYNFHGLDEQLGRL